MCFTSCLLLLVLATLTRIHKFVHDSSDEVSKKTRQFTSARAVFSYEEGDKVLGWV